jgi:hypothetical protein
VLKTKTVFVLGAGASVPFGFPSGPQLTRNVVNDLLNRGWLHKTLIETLKLDEGSLQKFANVLRDSGRSSIDAFLEYRLEYMTVGKAAIAASLISCERPSYVMKYDDDNWLRYLYNQLNSSFDYFSQNQLGFVTFNYDRIVEWFLLTCLQNSFGKPMIECLSVLASIPIVHLHGRLGYLPWENAAGRDFNNKIDEEGLLKGIDQIKIIHEDITDDRDADFEKAKQLLALAEHVYFMGFGFNRLNVERLEISKLDQNKSIATSVGITGQERRLISRLTNGKVEFIDADCISLCRNNVIWS